MHINISQASDAVMDVLKVKLVPFVTSSPGLGKSSLAAQIADQNNLQLVDIRLSQCDPSDLAGLPFVQEDNAGHKRATYLPINIWPLEGDTLPEGKDGWLILLDEFNSAPLSVQAAAYKLVLDRQVGMYPLHPRALLMAAGNLSTDKAIVNRTSTAMQSRLIHFTLEVDKESWMVWADANGIDHRIKSFINFKPAALHRFDANHTEDTYPAPRTWEFLSRIIKHYPTLTANKLPVIAGCIGEGMAREFYSYSQIYTKIPNISNILKDPENVSFDDTPSTHHALVGMVASYMTPENTDTLKTGL